MQELMHFTFLQHPLPVLKDAREKYTEETVTKYALLVGQGQSCQKKLEELPGFTATPKK
jgi:hypothetical protein